MIYFAVWLISIVAWMIITRDEELDQWSVIIMTMPIVNTGSLITYCVSYWFTKWGDD